MGIFFSFAWIEWEISRSPGFIIIIFFRKKRVTQLGGEFQARVTKLVIL